MTDDAESPARKGEELLVDVEPLARLSAKMHALEQQLGPLGERLARLRIGPAETAFRDQGESERGLLLGPAPDVRLMRTTSEELLEVANAQHELLTKVVGVLSALAAAAEERDSEASRAEGRRHKQMVALTVLGLVIAVLLAVVAT